MTVEATGPFGQFLLKAEDRKIVLLAAGSGITPMMAMLRYIDDLCLDVEARLLYYVRTSQDVIFERELTEMEARLKSFQYQVVLSQPDPDWTGARGHINGDHVSKLVRESLGRVFFVCGPPPFMEAARQILMDLKVEPEQIRQETFGGAGAEGRPAPRGAEASSTVEFARTRKTAVVAANQPLLETAAANGVDFPSACRQGQCGRCKTRLLEGRDGCGKRARCGIESAEFCAGLCGICRRQREARCLSARSVVWQAA